MAVKDAGSRRETKRATILDVARLAGVSHQTVSRYLRHNGGLRPGTVLKIDKAIHELDYRPDLVARSMRTRRSNRIAIVLPELTCFVPADLRGASRTAREAGYLVSVVTLEGDDRNRHDRVLDLLNSERVDGILALTPLGTLLSTNHDSMTTPIHELGEYNDKIYSKSPLADDALTAQIVEHLAGIGHRRLMHVTGALEWTPAQIRRDAYLKAVDRLGLESYGVVEGDWTTDSGYEAVRHLPSKSGITAILAANDFTALGVIRGLQDRGIRVPDDISVFGWGDEEFTRYMVPTMSTVRLDRKAYGREAMEALIADITGNEQPAGPEERVGDLVMRESSGPAQRP